jgi:hypothetical protein
LNASNLAPTLPLYPFVTCTSPSIHLISFSTSIRSQSRMLDHPGTPPSHHSRPSMTPSDTSEGMSPLQEPSGFWAPDGNGNYTRQTMTSQQLQTSPPTQADSGYGTGLGDDKTAGLLKANGAGSISTHGARMDALSRSTNGLALHESTSRPINRGGSTPHERGVQRPSRVVPPVRMNTDDHHATGSNSNARADAAAATGRSVSAAGHYATHSMRPSDPDQPPARRPVGRVAPQVAHSRTGTDPNANEDGYDTDPGKPAVSSCSLNCCMGPRLD